jgi:ubiquinone/menaquinone biosynthesis C-methylase UbiE
LKNAREAANSKYRDETWSPLVVRPNALSTTRHDDIARLIRNERGCLLEIGSGAGQLLIALADQFDHLVGLDISDLRIALAEEVLAKRYPQYQSKICFQQHDVNQKLPFEDACFDVVIACVVIEVVPDVFGLFDELARVCKPGGCLLASVANVCYLKHVFAMLCGRIPVTWSPTRDMAQWRERGWDDGALRYFSKSALSDLLQHTGFKPEAWSGAGSLARLRRWYINSCGALTVRARRTGDRVSQRHQP